MPRTKREVVRESRSFPFYTTALNACALRLEEEQPFDSGKNVFILETDQFAQPVHFEILLDVNLESLARQSSVPLRALRLGVILQNDDTKRHAVLESWDYRQLPKTWDGTIGPTNVSSRQVNISLIAYLSEIQPRSLTGPWREGSVLAERSFAISLQGYASLFRVSWESFKERGWDVEALWHVDFRVTEAFDEAIPEDAVLVYTNKDLPALNFLMSPSALRHPKIGVLARLLLRLIGSMAIADVVIPVLLDVGRRVDAQEVRAEDIDRESLSGRVLATLREANVVHSEAVRLARESPSEIRERIQGLLKLGSNLDYGTLTRLTQI